MVYLCEVVNAAKRVQGKSGEFCAKNIQDELFPEFKDRYRSKEFGISAALNRAVRRGQIKRNGRGWYSIIQPTTKS